MFEKVVVKNQPTSYTPKVGIRIMLICIAMLTLTQTVGCRLGLQEAAMVTYRDMVWAKRAFNLRYGNCDRAYADHFENGFCAGYTSICDGGDGYVPALPPADYRSYEFQSADGARCVNSWFEGFPAGVAAAKKDKAGTYHDVLISRMIDSAVQQEQSPAKLPGDVPVVSANNVNRSVGYQSVPVVQPPNMQQYTPITRMPSVLQQGVIESPPQAFAPPIEEAGLPRIIQADYANPEMSAAPAPTSNEPLPMATVPASWNSTRRSN